MNTTQDQIKAFVETICYLKSPKWLNKQFGRNNWTPQELRLHPEYPHGEFWSEDELFDLIYINGLDYDYTLEWLDVNRNYWENL